MDNSSVASSRPQISTATGAYLFFDPLIIIGGDRQKDDPLEPNYCTRCDKHHYLPGKEYTFFTLKPLGEAAASGNTELLKRELFYLKNEIQQSDLFKSIMNEGEEKFGHSNVIMNSLKVPCLAEKALLFLLVEQNLVSAHLFKTMAEELDLDRVYLEQRLEDNGRTIRW